MTVNVNGVEIYYETIGSGAPLIMVHGNGEDHTIFDLAAQKLASHYTVYLPDSRGHGKSQKVNMLAYDDMAEDILAFVKALHLSGPVFYGFSDGGIVGLISAIKQKDVFAKMIISGANIHPRGVKDSLYYLFKAVYFFTHDPKIRMMLEQPNIPENALEEIRIPTLVLAGKRDLIKEAHTRMIADAIPGAQLKLLPGEGHGSYIVHKEKVADLILEFCD